MHMFWKSRPYFKKNNFAILCNLTFLKDVALECQCIFDAIHFVSGRGLICSENSE